MDDPFRRGHGRGAGAVEETSNPALDASHAAFAAMQADAARAKESGNESLVALRDVLIRQARRMDKIAEVNARNDELAVIARLDRDRRLAALVAPVRRAAAAVLTFGRRGPEAED